MAVGGKPWLSLKETQVRKWKLNVFQWEEEISLHRWLLKSLVTGSIPSSWNITIMTENYFCFLFQKKKKKNKNEEGLASIYYCALIWHKHTHTRARARTHAHAHEHTHTHTHTCIHFAYSTKITCTVTYTSNTNIGYNTRKWKKDSKCHPGLQNIFFERSVTINHRYHKNFEHTRTWKLTKHCQVERLYIKSNDITDIDSV